jgi:hypothetical protein
MWLRLNPGTNSFFLVERLRACVVNTRRSFPSRDVCWSSSFFDKAVRSREDPDLHIGVPSIIPRHFFGMFTSKRALRDILLRQESLRAVSAVKIVDVTSRNSDLNARRGTADMLATSAAVRTVFSSLRNNV